MLNKVNYSKGRNGEVRIHQNPAPSHRKDIFIRAKIAKPQAPLECASDISYASLLPLFKTKEGANGGNYET